MAFGSTLEILFANMFAITASLRPPTQTATTGTTTFFLVGGNFSVCVCVLRNMFGVI